MGKHREDWIPFHGWDSDDWKDAGRTALYTAAGVALGGIGGAALYGAGALGTAVGAGAAVGIGAAAGGALGAGKAEEIDEANELDRETRKAQARQEAQARGNEIMRKQSLLAANTTMTAREAMARNINAAIKKMYSPKTASNNPNPYTLGGEKEVLG